MEPAQRQVVAVLVVLGLALTIHLAGVGSTILNLALEANTPHGIFEIPNGSMTDEEAGEAVGRAIGFLLCGAYSALGLLWIPITMFGVYRRAPWGRTSALVYFATTIPTCCCLPIGAYGLYALMRADVKQLFGAAPASNQ